MRASIVTPLFSSAVLCGALLLGACQRAANTDQAQVASTQPGKASRTEVPGGAKRMDCKDLPDADALKRWLKQAPTEGEVGGLAGGRYEWAAVVDRNGVLCAIASGPDDPAAAWPGSQAIAKAKAYTANAFSSDTAPMSTARLYTLSQPGHSLWGAGAGDPFNPACLSSSQDDAGVGEVCGGMIVFGGGLPLYRGKTRVGGLGVSGDTPCADHEIAKRVRSAAKLDPEGGAQVDDISYSSVDGASVYTHPLCPNTWRNGKKIGEEPAAEGY